MAFKVPQPKPFCDSFHQLLGKDLSPVLLGKEDRHLRQVFAHLPSAVQNPAPPSLWPPSPVSAGSQAAWGLHSHIPDTF